MINNPLILLFCLDAGGNEGVVLLVDSDSNHFVLSKPKDTTTTHIDHNLLKEIIFITTLSFLLVLLGNFVNLPSNFACVVAGVLLGPSGGNYITVCNQKCRPYNYLFFFNQ